jgi:shikimate dehydrogenase
MNKIKFRLGLIGYPISHSFSPMLQKAFLKACDLDGEYRLIPVKEDAELASICNQVREGLIHGLNVTIPHKINIIRSVDGLSTTAREIGAVNTLYLTDGYLVGHNTDAEGFLQDLAHAFGEDIINSRGNGLILGAGGASRAVAHALLQSGWKVTIAARNISQAIQIRNDFLNNQFDLSVIELSKRQLAQQNPDLIINATPVGTKPSQSDSPWPLDLLFPLNSRVYDLVYNPAQTTFLKKAKSEEKETRNGTGMLVYQAAAAFEYWTGCKVPKKSLAQALDQVLVNLERNEK